MTHVRWFRSSGILVIIVTTLLIAVLLPLRSTRAASMVKAQYKAADTVAADNQIKPHLQLLNTGTAAVTLSTLKVRYYYTKEGTAAEQYWCDYATLGCANITGSFGAGYLELGFTAGAGTLAPGAGTGEIQNRFAKTDWSNYNEADDYSFDASKTAFADWAKVTLYENGTLIWGTPPGGSQPPTNTGVPPSATRTNTTGSSPTRTRTNTTGSSPTRTNTTGSSPTRTRTNTTGSSPTRTNTTGPVATSTRTSTPLVTPTSTTGQNNVLYVGRFNTSDPAGPRSAWSATTIKANFTGTGISANLSSVGDNWYNVVVDGVVLPKVHVAAGTNGLVPLASGLASGNHMLELVRRTEAWVGEVQFKGFMVTGGQLLAAPAASTRRIEFIGDSITAGYGNEGPNQYQSFTTQNENAYLAYGPVAARTLGADQFTIAWSGKGLIRNYGGDTTDVLPSIYSRILPYDTTTLWNPSQWIPNVVLINLGTNDFSIGAPDKTAFTSAYVNFVKRIRGQYPSAHIYCALGPMLNGTNLTSARDYITTVVNQLVAAGDTKVHFIEFPMQDGSLGYGEDWHPSVAQHAAMANVLVNRLKADLGW